MNPSQTPVVDRDSRLAPFVDLEGQNFSFLGKSAELKGNFRFNGPVKISASLEGELKISSPFKATIEYEGRFKGNVECYDLEIFGEFDGLIMAQGKVVLHPLSRVTGTIQAANLTIYPGAVVNIEGHAES